MGVVDYESLNDLHFPRLLLFRYQRRFYLVGGCIALPHERFLCQHLGSWIRDTFEKFLSFSHTPPLFPTLHIYRLGRDEAGSLFFALLLIPCLSPSDRTP